MFTFLTVCLSFIGVDKGLGLTLLCSHLDIPISESIAFGDGENDKEFLAASGIGCAMKNGRPAAKDAANIITEVNMTILIKRQAPFHMISVTLIFSCIYCSGLMTRTVWRINF